MIAALLLTVMWLPAVAPMELVAHEGMHALTAKAVGARDIRLKTWTKPTMPVSVHFRGASRNGTVATILAPKVLQLGLMAGGFALLMVVENEAIRGLLRCVIAAAAFDFAFSTGDWKAVYRLARQP